MSKDFTATILAAASLLTTGCSFRTQATGMAMDYNEFVAQTTNRQTVLNVLRAREREPMHFTSFAIVRGTVRGQASAELGASIAADTAQSVIKSIDKTSTPAGGAVAREETAENTATANDNATSYAPKVGLQITTGTDFDIAVNATDEFYKGILGPLKESVVVHFLRQGFPSDLLSHLVIGDMRFSAVFRRDGQEIDRLGRIWVPGEEKYGQPLVKTMRNHPDEPESAEDFERNLDCRNLSFVLAPTDKRSVGFDALSDLSSVPPEVLAKVSVTKAQERAYGLEVGAGSEFRLALSEPKSCEATRQTLIRNAIPRINDLAVDLKLGGTPLDAVEKRESETAVAPRRTPLPGRNVGPRAADGSASSEGLTGSGTYQFETKNFFGPLLKARGFSEDYTGDLVIELTLRSVEGVLYYLGEYVRNAATSPRLYGPSCRQDEAAPCIPILVASKSRDLVGEPLAEVSYRGRRYAVPLSGSVIGPEAGRSSQTVSLVQQLLNLHRSSKDLPVTPLVRVAN